MLLQVKTTNTGECKTVQSINDKSQKKKKTYTTGKKIKEIYNENSILWISRNVLVK
jgi:hypothetical protein